MKVKLERNIRYAMGNEYHERTWKCPKCGKTLAYHNDVILVFGSKDKFCSECGTKLEWDE